MMCNVFFSIIKIWAGKYVPVYNLKISTDRKVYLVREEKIKTSGSFSKRRGKIFWKNRFYFIDINQK